MILRAFLLLTGFGFSVVGGVHIISYLNLMAAGKTFQEYVQFILYRIECQLFLVGLVFMLIAIFSSSKNQR
ncbi:hypothetical protein [Bacillus chungangensis]|uniref:DMSO/TMAO reductase YedYZ heme-binding membrane subunit n=1 Tax=Bacillus chungangensis TaxID=587633 RepID=A0ABT9WPE7_9BACI|nr:hypothetical protein [Bacillus chungangensis]MDQ0174645.1 DMSO/TMAO reductase YedYZ heme-binding membrane subunit [Bacillus chungangensis]